MAEKYVLAYKLYLEGLSYREISRRIYGGEYINRVKRLLNHARKRFGSMRIVLSFSHDSDSFIDLKKKFGKGHFRQLFTHEQFMYYILNRVGLSKERHVWSTVKHLHYELFPLVWRHFGDRLRCWRNGSGKVPFSFTEYSLAYVLSLVQSVLLIYGYTFQRSQVEIVIKKELLGERRNRKLIGFQRVYDKVAAIVVPRVIYPQSLILS